MSRIRVLALFVTLGVVNSFADSIPSPFFPPDPHEDLPPALSNEIPSPFFPPDPHEDLPPA